MKEKVEHQHIYKDKDYLNKIIENYLEDILKLFKNDAQFIALTWSFSVWEESYSETGAILSDIDYYAVLKKGVDDTKYINQAIETCKKLNKLKYYMDPDCSIWVTSNKKFFEIKEDTITPYQIEETRKILYWTLEKSQNPIEIEFNSKLWLCWVAYWQLLSWIKEKDYRLLAKAVFNQIWVILIKEKKYTTSYRWRIINILPHINDLNITEKELEDAFSIKIYPTEKNFTEKFWTINNFLQTFEKIFCFSTLQKTFIEKLNLKDFCDYMVEDGDIHKYIRVAYICYYLNNPDLANNYIQIASNKMNCVFKKEGLELINSVWEFRLHKEGII